MRKKCLRTVFICAVGSFLLLGQLHAQALEGLKRQVTEKTLKNGMKFIVMEQHQVPLVSFHVYADVGSAQEVQGITGISHLLEHMAFKGSSTLGTKDYAAEAKVLDELDQAYQLLAHEEQKLKPDAARVAELQKKFAALQQQAKEFVVNNEYFDIMMQNGDNGVNAYTSSDATQYINYLPANRLEFWMAVTSDRFLNPVFREFYKERDVVMEERRLGVETRPNSKLFEDLLATAFKAHPYHHMVVGHMADLKRITHQDVKDYFKKYYSPANLTAAVVGDVDPQEVFRLAELYFGRISSDPKPEPLRTVEPEQWGERRATVVAQSQPILMFGYHRPAVTHGDDLALEALSNIIGKGRSSRLWETLVKKEKAAAAVGVMNGFPGDKYPTLIVFYAVPSKDRTAAECLQLIDKEIGRLKTEPVTAQELTKFKQTKKKNTLDQLKDNASLASLLTYYDVVQGDWRLLFAEIKRVDGLTATDIQRVANTYLGNNNRTVGELIPESK
ncbi:MAG: pitrilysin family protein [Candidatus Aminicenantes bacterium]|nr:pitrilysin family protein [Candidatus Aminicenantes bacterium]